MARLQAHGFASLNGGTTGGSGGSTITVSNGKALQAAIDNSTGPLTILVQGTITAANTGAREILIDGRKNLTIQGAGDGGELNGIGIHVKNGSSNLIIQNLKIHHVPAGAGDAIGIEGGSHNIWIDGNELYSSMSVNKDYYDGLLDLKRGTEYVTVSNNYFHDHHKVSLVGYSDSDEGGRYITYNHNIFQNVGSRLPSVRDGYVHIYENYYKDVETSGINLRMGAVGLIENNVFVNVRDPVSSQDSAAVGRWDLRGNSFENVEFSKPGKNEAVATSNESDTASYNVPYSYSLVGTGKVAAYVQEHAGVGQHGSTPTPTPTPSPTPTPTPTPPSGGSGSPLNLVGDGDSDALSGGNLDDTLDGRGGADKLMGGLGNDVLFGRSGADTLDGGAGNDVMRGGSGDDVMTGGDGLDRVLGDGGDDMLSGNQGRDVLEGGSGADTLSGGLGRDLLTGDSGKDVFLFRDILESPASDKGRDVIADFTKDDVIDLRGIDADTTKAGDQAFQWINEAAFTDKPGQLRVSYGEGPAIISGDVNGDGNADFQIELANQARVNGDDFLF